MKQKGIQYFKWVLPILFTAYYSCIAFYAHIHIQDDVVIIHSHPFSHSSDKNPHEHSSSEELILFHALSSIQVLDGAIHSLTLDGFTAYQSGVLTYSICVSIPISILGNLYLRAPPQLLV